MGPVSTDPYLWLEDITGEDALDWVRARNAPTVAEFAGEEFEARRAAALEVLDTDARIPYVRRRGDHLYNFWRDAANPRGCGGAPRWRATAATTPSGRCSSTSTSWADATTPTGCGPAQT